MYMIYLSIVEHVYIYKYGMYLILYIIILILDTIVLRKYAKNSYVTGILLMLITIMIFTGKYIMQKTIICTLVAIFFYVILYKLREQKRKSKKSEKQIADKISIGFFLGTFNIIMVMLMLLLRF